MNVYETIVIFNASLNDEATEAVIAKVSELITGNGGTVLKTDVWGRRKMSYEINKQTRGNYVMLCTHTRAHPIPSASSRPFSRSTTRSSSS